MHLKRLLISWLYQPSVLLIGAKSKEWKIKMIKDTCSINLYTHQQTTKPLTAPVIRTSVCC